ncbi:hypothetical protein LNAOJCKE_5274 [Methylorubrum aminovorans]|uniref:Uncharacterized protein n=1 Tax=Methylorubrum aminovorans TaxID=269069 RepID=A0ABQ4ULE9_9HYPH|nr:hypothetical protein [Methylorubrum aminovorans]GJE68038.1 hypothetical protein LNAOJCKE_5274 [Methylorubrum aminovorans]GMA75655.1 hypothetical protein GCM10025880_20720 [Methylorubrum aminovorans]
MPTAFTATAALHLRDLRSVYDPVLHGVAGGLADLFPPIHNLHRPEAEVAVEAAMENNEWTAQN